MERGRVITGIILCIFLVLSILVTVSKVSYSSGYEDGIREGRDRMQKEAVARGFAHYEYRKHSQDDYGFCPISFEWNRSVEKK